MLLYINATDIRNARLGTKACPIAQALRRKFPPAEGEQWVVNYCGGAQLWAEQKRVRRFNLSVSAERLMQEFDTAERSPYEGAPVLRPRHIRLYPRPVEVSQ